MFRFLTKVLAIVLPTLAHGFEIQGHRGARGMLPENTLPSFEAAIEAGVNGMEMDLLMTKDGEIVIHHDFFVNSMLCTYWDGSPIEKEQLIKEMTLAELKQLDCGRVQHPGFPHQKTIPGTTIPTLQELFALIDSSSQPNAKKVYLNLEIKADPITPHFIPPYPEVAKKIVQLVHEGGFAKRVYYSSFDFAILEEVRKLDPEATVGLLIEVPTLIHAGVDLDNWTPYILEWAAKLQAAIVSPDYDLLTRENIQVLHKAGLRVIPWTINDPKECHRLIEMGADGMITDYPVGISYH